MIQAQSATDQVEAGVDAFRCSLQTILHILCALLMQKAELCLAGEHCIHRAQQPVEVEVIAARCPCLEFLLHRVTGFRPVGANLCESQIALGELSTATVDTVEDIHHHVE